MRTVNTPRRIPAIAALLALVVVGTAHADGIDGPGRYYVFRTLDSGSPPTDGQNRRCADHFGPLRTPTAFVRANALLFSFRSDPLTGRTVDQTAGFLGPGFICSAPAPGSSTGFEAFAYTSLPDTGEADLDGPCSLAPVLAQPGALFFNCTLAVRPDEQSGLLGGLAASNSIVNPRNVAPGTPSGSVWTAYVVTRPGGAAPPPSPPPARPPALPSTRGLDFYVLRSFEHAIDTRGCRLSALSSTSPDPRNGRLDQDELLYPDARATLCATGSEATALVELRRGGSSLPIAARGACRESPTPAGAELRQQACSLTVEGAPGIRGGLVTTTGLVSAGEAANSHVWTVALLADPVEDPADSEPPRVRLALPRASRTSRIRVRWSGTDTESRIRAYTVELRPTGRSRAWRTVEAATTRTATTLRLRRGRRYLVRVRAADRAGNVGPWATGSITVIGT